MISPSDSRPRLDVDVAVGPVASTGPEGPSARGEAAFTGPWTRGLPPGATVRVTLPPQRARAQLRTDSQGGLVAFLDVRPSPEALAPAVVRWLEDAGLSVRSVRRQGARLRVDAIMADPPVG